MKAYLKLDYILRVMITIVAVLIISQMVFNRKVYDVTVYTYSIMSSYYSKNITDQRDNLLNYNPNNLMDFTGDKFDNDKTVSNKDAGSSGIGQITSIYPSTIDMKKSSGSDSPSEIVHGNIFGENGTDIERCTPQLGTIFTPFYNCTTDSRLLGSIFSGEWSPSDCHPTATISLIIPFRQRHLHLQKFLPYMHSFLQKQLLHYRIFIIEQNDSLPFNRAKLFNVGYKEASAMDNYTCFIFHDVDLLPLDERILYNCSTKGPMHLAAAMDKFHFNMPYVGFLGGVCAMTPEQFEKMNGFSNKFFGWGGEDDDISYRINFSGQTVERYPVNIGRYHMIKHGSDKGNEVNPERHRLLEQTQHNWKLDGLNSLTYNVTYVQEEPLFTKITVHIA